MSNTAYLNMFALERLVVESGEEIFDCTGNERVVFVVFEDDGTIEFLDRTKYIMVIFCNIGFFVFLEFEDEFDRFGFVGGHSRMIGVFLDGVVGVSHCCIGVGAIIEFRHCRQLHAEMLRRSYTILVPWYKAR